MNFYEFCNDSEVLQYFDELALGGGETKHLIAEKWAEVSIQYCELPKNLPLNEKEWENIREDIQHDFLIDKLYNNKVNFKPEMAKLSTYLMTILARQILQLKREKSLKNDNVLEEVENDAPLFEEDISDTFAKKESLVLKKACLREVQVQSCLRRTILKLSYPYFFNYEFEPDEESLLTSKGNCITKLKSELQDEMAKRVENKSKLITISPDKIAKWLAFSKRNTVERHLCVLRKRLSWLRKENLRNALAEENF